MFKIEDTTIHLTRGDIAIFEVSTVDEDGNDYIFQVDDIIRFSVFEKNNLNNIKIQKDIVVTEETDKVVIKLTSEDTAIDNIINKPANYWYEIKLNPDDDQQTIIGYDENGAKILTLYPEGVDNDDKS